MPREGRTIFVKNNPPQAGQVMSRDVLAVVYRHVTDDPNVIRVHGFGDANLKLGVRNRGDSYTITIAGLEDLTSVRMVAEPDGTIRLIHKLNKSLWGKF